MIMQGPVVVDIKVAVISDGPEVRTGEYIVTMPRGTIPTKEAIEQEIAEFREKHMPPGFRMMTKQEFWDYQLRIHQLKPVPIEGALEFEP